MERDSSATTARLQLVSVMFSHPLSHSTCLNALTGAIAALVSFDIRCMCFAEIPSFIIRIVQQDTCLVVNVECVIIGRR